MGLCEDLLICGVCKTSFSFLPLSRFIEHKMQHVNIEDNCNPCCLCSDKLPNRKSLLHHLEHFHAIEFESFSTANPYYSLQNRTLTEGNQHYEPSSYLQQSDDSHSHPYLSNGEGKEQHGNGSKLHRNKESLKSSDTISVDILEPCDSDKKAVYPLQLQYSVCDKGQTTADLKSKGDESNTNFCTVGTDRSSHSAQISNASCWSQNPNSSTNDNSSSSEEKSMQNTRVVVCRLDNSSDKNKVTKKATFGDTKQQQASKEIDFKGSLSLNETESNDFHFFFGCTSIKGNSMTYERVEFKCMHCNFSSAWRPSLIKHMKTVHTDILPYHSVLDIQSVSLGAQEDTGILSKYRIMKLSDHTAMTKTSKKKKRKRSIELQDVPGKYQCPICNKVFSRLRYIRRHQVIHKAQRDYLCDNCGKSFKTKATLVAHSQSHGVKMYHCPQCDFVSSVTGEIHRHRQLHPNGSVLCDVCGAAYMDKSTLKKHKRVHDCSRPFACTFSSCTWRFKSEVLMKAHVKAHSVEGKFQCSVCLYRFRHKHHLQRHVTRIHPQISLPEKLSYRVLPLYQPAVVTIAEPTLNSAIDSIVETPYEKQINLNFDQNSLYHSKIIPSLKNQHHLLEADEEKHAKDTLSENTVDIIVHSGEHLVTNAQSGNGLEYSCNAINFDGSSVD